MFDLRMINIIWMWIWLILKYSNLLDRIWSLLASELICSVSINLHPDSIYILVSPFEFLDLMLIGIKKNSFFVKRNADYRYVLQLIRCYLWKKNHLPLCYRCIGARWQNYAPIPPHTHTHAHFCWQKLRKSRPFRMKAKTYVLFNYH